MLHALELRSPILERKVFHLVSQLDLEFTIKKGRTKYVLREVMKDIVQDLIFIIWY